MSRNKHNKKQAVKHSRAGEFAVFVVALILLTVVPVLMLGTYAGDERGHDSEIHDPVRDAESAPSEMDSPIAGDKSEAGKYVIEEPADFPILLENGGLEITSVFRYDGINPDCSNQQGNDITAIEVRNLSDVHLKNAVITMGSSDAGILHFNVSELPSGKAAVVFAAGNDVSDDNTIFGDVLCEADFEPGASVQAEKVSVSVEGTHITLTNKTAAEIHDIDVYCRSVLDDRYFGGVAYSYTINNLPAYGTAEFEAADCILGFAEVVRIDIN